MEKNVKPWSLVRGERSVSPEVGSWPEVGELASKRWANWRSNGGQSFANRGCTSSCQSRRDVRCCCGVGLNRREKLVVVGLSGMGAAVARVSLFREEERG